MKVLYDFQVFQWQAYGGISRYYYELMNYYTANKSLDFDLALKYSPNFYLQNSTFANDKATMPSGKTINDFLWGKNFKGKGRLFNAYSKATGSKSVDTFAANKQYSIEMLKQADFDVFHPTNYDPYYLDYVGNKPFVMTFYDLVHEIFPELMMWDTSYVPRKRLAEKATKIIAISNTTKQDLINIYGIDEKKIEVIYLASSLDPSLENKELKLPAKYLLYVGNREFYKNFYFFARVFAALAKEDPELHIVCAGGGNFKQTELDFFKVLGIENKVIFAGSDDKSIATSYKNALAFLTPTYYEGFNIPIVEAFSCGCPVIAANTGPSPEVGADAAEYFSPKDFVSMRDAIKNVIYNDSRKKELISKGTERLKDFSWEKTAQQTQKLYESIV